MDITKNNSFVEFILILLLIIPMLVGMKVVPEKSISTMAADSYILDLKMPKILPRRDDEYFCTGSNISMEELYIKKFEPNADSKKIHHIIIFGCRNLRHSHLYPNYWSCSHSELCPGMRVLYAWGRNAPSLNLPPNVGFHVGGAKSDVNYLVLQAHYAHPLKENDSSGVRLFYTIQPQPFVAGIFLLASLNGLIPPNQPKSHVDINCRLNRDPITVFAYRVHAHALSTVISGYRYSTTKKQWDLIAKGNPQWPQAFYPLDQVKRIESDDIISARCTYNSTTQTTLTVMGSTADDEMCNLYLMYYSENPLFSQNSLFLSKSTPLFYIKSNKHLDSCEDMEFETKFFSNLPDGNDQPLPRNLTMEESAIGQHGSHHHQNFHSSRSNGKNVKKIEFSQDPQWPFGNSQFGQITAADFDDHGNLVIFHRGNHVWNQLSFDLKDNYRRVRDGPIAQPTIVIIDVKSKKILDSWGENLFFLPHGLTIFHQNRSIWLTDVAMHQVFKYSLDPDSKNYRKPLMTLGERFKPGKDNQHFCKPTSVVIDYSNGEFYVADGYCNNRIIRFNSDGKYLNHWGQKPVIKELKYFDPPPNFLNVPHKILLIDRNSDDENMEKLACIADRENGRIECFLAPYGQFLFQIRLPQFNGRLFSIAYSKPDDILYAVSGPSLTTLDLGSESKQPNVMAFAFDFQTREPIATFAPKLTGTFNQPHDIAVSPTGSEVYVVEIGPNNIWKFINNHMKSKGIKQDSVDDSMFMMRNNLEPAINRSMMIHDSILDASKMKMNQSIKSLNHSNTNVHTNQILKSKIIEPNLGKPSFKHYQSSADNGRNASGKINFSFELLQIRTREFREKVWSNNLLYFLLLAMFIFIIILNIHHSSSSLRFCSLLTMSLLNILKNRLKRINCHHSSPISLSSHNSERICLSDVLKKARRKNRELSKDKRYSGFNRLPQNEEESDLVLNFTDDDDDDGDDSDVLEDFNLSRINNKNNHVI